MDDLLNLKENRETEYSFLRKGEMRIVGKGNDDISEEDALKALKKTKCNQIGRIMSKWLRAFDKCLA